MTPEEIAAALTALAPTAALAGYVSTKPTSVSAGLGANAHYDPRFWQRTLDNYQGFNEQVAVWDIWVYEATGNDTGSNDLRAVIIAVNPYARALQWVCAFPATPTLIEARFRLPTNTSTNTPYPPFFHWELYTWLCTCRKKSLTATFQTQ